MSSHHSSFSSRKKGKTLIAILTLSLLTFTSQSQTILFNEDYESTFPPNGWSVQSYSSGETWRQYWYEWHSGHYSVAQFPNNGAPDAWLYTLPLNLQAGRYYVLSYYAKLNENSHLKISLNKSTSFSGEFKTIRTIDGGPLSTWNLYNDTIIVETSGTYYVGFNNRAVGGSYQSAYLDDISFTELNNYPTCSAVNAGTITSSVSTICAGNSFILSNTNATNYTEKIRYSWQKSTDGITWTNITNGYTYERNIQLAQTVPTWYRLTDTCVLSGASSVSNQVLVDITPFLNCYCTPAPLDCSNYAFLLVKIPGTSLEANTGCSANGYGNYSNITAPTVYRGQTLNITHSSFPPANAVYSVGIWIDLDHSGSFEEKEFVVNHGLTGSANSSQYLIPANALTGPTRMRMKVRFYTSTHFMTWQESCSAIAPTTGEIEDYTINIVDPPNCTGAVTAGTISSVTQTCPNTNFNINVTGATTNQGQMRYAWQSSTDGVTWTNINNTSYLITPVTLSENATTSYRLTDTCLATGQTSISNVISVPTSNILNCYCTPAVSNCSVYAIEEVSFNTIQNVSSTCTNGYSNYTNIGTTVNNGTIVPISLKFKASTNSKNITILIDLNRNGIYENSERVLTAVTSANTFSGFIKIPFNVKSGETGMRISVSSLIYLSSCSPANSAGEVEDYKINLNVVNPLSGRFSLYVKQNASGSKDGSSWANAFTALDSAIAFASPNDTIKVAKGTYKPGTTNTSVFNLKDSLIIMGGYPDSGNPLDADRNVGTNPTILSGEIGTAVKTDNIKIIVQAWNIKGFLLDGFIIENGYDGSTSTNGPVRILNATGTIKNTVIRNNFNFSNGCALNVQGSTLNLVNNIIENNATDGSYAFAAPLNFSGKSNVTIVNCVIAKNRGKFFLNLQNSTAKILGSTIFKNFGIGSVYDTSQLILQNSIFYNNVRDPQADVQELKNDYYSSIDINSTITELFNNTSNQFNGQNPKFRDSANIAGPDNLYFTNDDGLQLINPCSPAINTGNNSFTAAVSTDISGNPRIKNGVVDLGAYEVQEALGRQPEVLYVNKNATGQNTGLSWQDAFTDLQKAFYYCSDTIKVAKGTYQVSTTDASAYLQLDNNRVVMGGFPNTGSPNNSSFDPEANPTIIDGTVNATEKSYVLVLSSNNNSSARLIGFQLINSQQPSNVSSVPVAAALKVTQKSNAWFEKIKIDAAKNLQTQLISVSAGSNPVFYKSVFFNVYSPTTFDYEKRSIIINDQSNPVFLKCYIGKDTTSSQAGNRGVGLVITDASPIIDSCIFNRATGNAIVANGGKPLIRNTLFARTGGRSMTLNGSSPVVTNCVFLDSLVNSDLNGGTIGNYANSSPQFIKCQFVGSRSNRSGGVCYNENSSSTFKSCVFNGPIASSGGSGFHNTNSQVTLINCLGINLDYDATFLFNNSTSTATVINSTLIASTAISKPVIVSRDNSSLKFYNSIIWRYGLGGQSTNIGNDITTDNNNSPAVCDIRNSMLFKQVNTAMVKTKVGINPKFAELSNPEGKDVLIYTTDDGLVPCSCSPLVNGGDNTLVAEAKDVIDMGRIYGGTVDIGAYELQVNATDMNSFYVKQSAPAGGNGLSWSTAYNNLQQAVQNYCADTIRVAKGVYKPAVSSRDSTFNIYTGQSLIGGYPDTGNPANGERDPFANPTILSGDIGVANDSTDNSYSVLRIHCPDTAVILDGLIIERGNADGASQSIGDLRSSGGGIYSKGNKHLYLKNCIIRNNYGKWGGGFFSNLSNQEIIKTVITDNNALRGGGFYISDHYSVVDDYPWSPYSRFLNSVISKNRGTGGVISGTGVNVDLLDQFSFDNVIIYKNQGSDGAGLLLEDNPYVKIRNCAFVRNNNTGFQAGIAILVRHLYLEPTLNTYVYNTIFKENLSNGGPGQYLNNDFDWRTGSYGSGQIPYGNFDYNLMNSGGSQTGAGFNNIGGTLSMKDIDNGPGPDNKWMTKDDGLQVTPCAININKGTNQHAKLPLDIQDSTRIQDFVVDIGPYESGYMTASITASDTAICPGTQVNFSAKASNAGPSPVYQWTLNGVNVGTNSPTYSSSTLNENDKIRVKVKNIDCVTFDTAYSNIITVHVGTSLTPVATITASDMVICSGKPVTFKAAVTLANSNTIYQWTVNNINAGTNSPIFTASNLANGDIVKVLVTINGSCLATQTVTSNGIAMVVNPQLTPSVSITASAGTICTGAQISYTATPVNGGTTPSYQWKVNGFNAGTNSPLFNPVTVNNNDNISVVMTNSASCVNTTATSNIIVQQVNAYLQPSVTISSTPITCPGNLLTFTANVSNGGSNPSYLWMLNGADIGVSTNTYASSSLGEGDVLEVQVTSNAACINSAAVKSQPLTMHYSSGVLPAVSISTPTSSGVCPGISVSFTAAPTNGGSNPVYQWLVNNINTGQIGSVFTTNSLSNRDEVKLIMKSSASCPLKPEVTSNTIFIKGPAAPTITANGALTFCEGGSVHLTSSSATGNQWLKNGVPINGATGANYTITSSGSYSVMTLANGCLSQTATAINVTVASLPAIPTITLTGNQLSTTAGMTSYQWYLNNVPVVGATTNTITPASNGSYKVEVGNSTGCKTSSAEYNFVLTAVSNVTVNGLEITCFPNPASHELNIKLSGIPTQKPLAQLIDQAGRVIAEIRLTGRLQTLNVSRFANGIYLLNVIGKEKATIKVEIVH